MQFDDNLRDKCVRERIQIVYIYVWVRIIVFGTIVSE